MDPAIERQLAVLERRARTLTGIILGVAAFLAAYGLMLFEGLTDRPGFHFYPWLLGVVFYLAGDLLAFVWFKTVSLSMVTLLRGKNRERVSIAPKRPPVTEEGGEVEIIRPPETGE